MIGVKLFGVTCFEQTSGDLYGNLSDLVGLSFSSIDSKKRDVTDIAFLEVHASQPEKVVCTISRCVEGST